MSRTFTYKSVWYDFGPTAIELDARRMQRVGQTLDRLGLQAQLHVGDASRTQDWWDGVPFDGILLDAPCTASGIVRRHPDVRWLRREMSQPEDLDALISVRGDGWPGQIRSAAKTLSSYFFAIF